MSIVLFLDISGGELIVILAAIFLIFGPRKIPEIARQLGKGMNEIRRVTYDIRKEIREETSRISDPVDEKPRQGSPPEEKQTAEGTAEEKGRDPEQQQ